MGEDQGRGDYDAFEQLRDPNFVAGASVREPSAEERARNAERVARQADLRRRLAEEAVHEQQLATTYRRRERARNRHVRVRYVSAAAILLAVVLGITWTSSRQEQAATGIGSVSRPPDVPPIDESVSTEPLGHPPSTPEAPGPFAFAMLQDDGKTPAAWDPCRPIRYVVNDTNAPPGTAELVDAAITRMSMATGLQFVSEGASDEEWSKDRESYQPDRYGEKWAPVLIDWASPMEVPDLEGQVAGYGGAEAVSAADGQYALVSGGLVLDAGDLGAAMRIPGGAEAVRAVIQHELGHVVGLDHVNDSTQIMNPEGSNPETTDWGTGDLAGLHELGTGECFPDL